MSEKTRTRFLFAVLIPAGQILVGYMVGDTLIRVLTGAVIFGIAFGLWALWSLRCDFAGKK